MIAAYASRIFWFGAALIVLGAALVAYDPHAGKVALYWTAKTGFFIAGGIGVVALILGALVKAGKKAALWAALVLMFLSLVSFTHKALGFQKDVTTKGESHKVYSLAVTGGMAAVSFFALIGTARGVRTLPSEG